MRLSVRLSAVLSALLVASPARGHVAPSPASNNRYTKITLLGDHVRVAYTVFFGELPGAGERRRMDENGDGLLDVHETQAFAAALLAEVVPALKVSVDGQIPRDPWTVLDVGLGIATTQAGAFSVDLVLRARLADGHGTAHEVRFADGWMVPSPGEAEVRIEESPGVRAVLAHKTREPSGLLLHFVSQGRPKPDDGVLVRFVVDPGAPRTLPVDSAQRRTPLAWVVLGGVALAGLALWVRRIIGTRRDTSPPHSGPSTS